MCLIAALMVGVAGNELYFDKINFHELMPSDGIAFLGFFSIFIYYTYSGGRGRSDPQAGHPRRAHQRKA